MQSVSMSLPVGETDMPALSPVLRDQELALGFTGIRRWKPQVGSSRALLGDKQLLFVLHLHVISFPVTLSSSSW